MSAIDQPAPDRGSVADGAADHVAPDPPTPGPARATADPAAPASAGGVPARGVPAFAVDVAAAVLEPLPLDPAQILEGAPETSVLTLEEHRHGDVVVERGVWQITPGVATDVEVDELFVVVAGRATVEVEGGAPLELAPGVAGVLRAGDRTVWWVRETLRKVYVATTPADDASAAG